MTPETPGRFIGEQPPVPAQQEGQQPTTPSSGLFNNPYNSLVQEERVNNFISQTSPVQSLKAIDFILRGYVYDEGAKDWVQVADGIPPSIRLDFLQFITTDLSEDVRMTNLQPKQLNGVMESTIEWVVDYLDIIADEETIKDEKGNKMELSEEQMTKIAWILIKAVFFSLSRSVNGVERGKIYGSLNLGGNIDPQNPQPQQDNKKWFQFWK